MIAFLQRVKFAQVHVNQREIAAIGSGILALIGVEKHDDEAKADRLLERVLAYRIFADAQDKMNLSLRDVEGELLLVSQFTLAADTNKGNRPSFSSAAAPQLGEELWHYLVQRAANVYDKVKTGQFGADMQVSLCNDGPVSFWLQT